MWHKMDGLELAGRFSYITNALGYCGPDCAYEKFLEYVKGNKNTDDIEKALKRFEGLFPYLNAIAKKTGKKFTDYSVVEAYWIGNSLLDFVSSRDAILYL